MVRKLIAIVLIAATMSVNAASFSGQEPVCEHLMNVTSYVSQMRDAGVPWDAFEPWASRQFLLAVGDPEAFVKNDADVAYVISLFKQLWESPQFGAEQVFAACMMK